MIRINLLGQTRPKAARRPADTGAALPVVFIGAGVLLGGLFLFYFYHSWQAQLNDETKRIQTLQSQKTELEQVKQQVELFEKQKQVLQQRVTTIEQLQHDRTGGQELLDQVANTVSRAENLWLTSMSKKGSTLTVEGASASINSVANFITALKRKPNRTIRTPPSRPIFSLSMRRLRHRDQRRELRRPSRRTRHRQQHQIQQHRRRKDKGEPWQILSETCRW